MKRLCVIVIGLSYCVTSCAEGEPQRGTPSSSSEALTERPASDKDVAYAASELSRALAGDARLASVEVLKERSIVVHWEGPVDSKLQDLIGRFPGVQIAIETTHCSPGKLREYGSHLLATDPAVKVVSVAPDGSGLQLTLDRAALAPSDHASLERKYSEAAGCPVTSDF
jgi:hypothetical protein